MTAEAPPAGANKGAQMQAGPGKAAVAGRGAGSIVQKSAGLLAPARGVGGPAAAQMAPRGVRPPGMP